MYSAAGVGGVNPQNTMPVATVGGEPGGRAAVVVDDVHAAADGGQEQGTSTVIGGQAEPGRNVFEKPVEGVKSAEVPVAGGDAEGEVGGEPKVISVIAQQQPQVQQQKEGGSGDKEVKVEIEAQKKTEEQTATDVQAQQAPGGGGGRPAGPLAEAEAEAEKVAQELYPDAA